MKPAPLSNPSNKRAKWLGKVVEQLKQAMSENDIEQFETIYEDTVTQLKTRYLQCKQLTLPLHPPHKEKFHTTCSQLRMFAA